MKRLYQLVHNLTGTAPINPFSKSRDEEELASRSTDFFYNKSVQIREQFNGTSENDPAPMCTQCLSKFAPVMEDEVNRVIMKTKHCELDAIPTSLLKLLLPSCIPIITKIVNISQEQGSFVTSGKQQL